MTISIVGRSSIQLVSEDDVHWRTRDPNRISNGLDMRAFQQPGVAELL